MSAQNADSRELQSLFEAKDSAAVIEALTGDMVGRLDLAGRSPLHLAATYGLVPVLDTLIERGVDIDQRDFHDRTALMLAAEAGEDEAVGALLAAGARPGLQNTWGRTALMYAAHRLRTPVVERLLDAGALARAVDRSGQTAATYLGRRRSTPAARQIGELLRKAGGRKASPEELQARSAAKERKRAARYGIRPEDERQRMGETAVVRTLVLTIFCAFVATELMQLLLLYNALKRLVLPALRASVRDSYAPEPPEPASYRDRPSLDVVPEPGSPLYVSNLLYLGSAALAGVHKRAALDATPGFDDRMRTTFRKSLGVGVGAMVVFVAVPAMIGNTYVERAVLVVATAAMFALEGALRQSRVSELQAEEDARAERISRRLKEELEGRASPTGDFGLYLRSFQVTNRLQVGGVDLETQIVYAINTSLPIVALGQPGEHVGAGRIETTDDKWKDEVRGLMERARLLLVVPSERPGTMWEIERLREGGHLSRTIFIMPPELHAENEAFSEQWNRAATAMNAIGFEIPRHFHKGLFFSVDERGRLKDHAPFSMVEFLQDTIRSDSVEQDEDGQDDADNETADRLNETADSLDVAALALLAVALTELDGEYDGDGYDGGSFDGGSFDGGGFDGGGGE